MNTLSGYTVVRNGIELDYCFEQCILSMLPVCDEIVVCDSDSTDGTLDKLHEMQRWDRKIRIINRPWPNPHRDLRFVIDWMNYTRERLSCPMQFYLDADEVLDPHAIETIHLLVKDGKCAWFDRLNFYGSAHRTARSVCGVHVARMGPTRLWMPSDEPERDEPEIRRLAVRNPALKIFHYGFLRKPDAFYRKSKVVMNGFFGQEDPRVVKCEKEGVKDWAAAIPVPTEQYNGGHPGVMRDWLVERGWLD